MIIIPDIHGRTFWKAAVEQAATDEKIIFLGDYLDPYPPEGITRNQAIENFKEIIEFKKANDNNVILLLGNHDVHYFIVNASGSRRDNSNRHKIRDIFNENRYLFNLCYLEEINNTKYLFSHAGIIPKWAEENNIDINDIEKTVYTLNWMFENIGKDMEILLDQVGPIRGGLNSCGSIVWADINEHVANYQFKDVYQIFGHTQLQAEYIGTNIACLDRRDAFRLDDNGNIKRITFEDYAEKE